jgi:hypothetical protein
VISLWDKFCLFFNKRIGKFLDFISSVNSIILLRLGKKKLPKFLYQKVCPGEGGELDLRVKIKIWY